jgi:hypothetical protein
VATGLGAPVALALYPDGRTFAVADAGGGRVLRVAPGDAPTVLASGLSAPAGVAVDRGGNVYVTDPPNAVIRRIDAATGAVTALPVSFASPFGLALEGGALLVTDVVLNTISRVELATGATALVAGGLYLPTGLVRAPDGMIYVSDTGWKRIQRVVDGTVEAVVGGVESFRDSDRGDAAILPMYGVAVLRDGSIVASDPGSYRIRRISGSSVRTLAGSGRSGARDGAGLEAELPLPAGMATGADGTIYVADPVNGAIRAVHVG